MYDAQLGRKVEVHTDGTAGPYIAIGNDQVEDLRRLLSENDVPFGVVPDVGRVDGESAFAVFNLGAVPDVASVQRLLDSAIDFYSDTFRHLILQSTALRAGGRHAEAISLVEAQLGLMSTDCLINAYLAIIYAARDAGMSEVARGYARKLAMIDPDIPTVRKLLGSP